MRKLLWCEYKKTRRRGLFVTALLLMALQLAWSLYGHHYDEFMVKNGWMMLLYQIPLANTVFLPILAMIVSSRLADLEHRGGMLGRLCAVCDRGRLYDAKLLYGIGITTICVALNMVATISFGYYTGFAGAVPLRLYSVCFLFTFVPTVMLYCFQHMLAMLYRNQAIPFFVGIIGTFAGLFSMFLPSEWFQRLLLWGHYGALMFVGMFGWTKEERYAHAYYDVMEIHWGVCAFSAALAVALYVLGRHLFVKKEY